MASTFVRFDNGNFGSAQEYGSDWNENYPEDQMPNYEIYIALKQNIERILQLLSLRNILLWENLQRWLQTSFLS